MRKEQLFLKSILSNKSVFFSTEEILSWTRERNRKVHVNLRQVDLKEIKGWDFSGDFQVLRHTSGNFFSIRGINVRTNWGEVSNWDQPIIHQPEIGFLGFITKEIDGVLYFLIQAKIEPGNVNNVQLSPTLQATKSNYTQVHGGKKPLYLEYFLNLKKYTVLLDQLQSEQGARFLKKRNRNIIIKVDEEVPVYEDFNWMTLHQIKDLIKYDNVVNMDTRTVISGIPFGSYSSEDVNFYTEINENEANLIGKKMLRSELDNQSSLHSIDDIISWFTQLKSFCDLTVKEIPLTNVRKWVRDESEIRHIEDQYFKVIGVNVEIHNREVKSWYQPLIKPVQEGICAFIVKEINGNFHFLVQAKMECGNFDLLEMAPSVQCLTGNYMNENSISNLPFLKYVLEADQQSIIYNTLQSEEGGRFFQEQNRNLIILADDSFDIEVPENYIWMTLNQLKSFIRFNNYLNIQARSLISSIWFN